MDLIIEDLDTIKDADDAWTRYLKPVIDDIKVQIEQNPNTVTSEKNISFSTHIILHMCKELKLWKEFDELALKIIIDYCNMEISEPLKQLKDESFLQVHAQCWEKFKIFANIICSLFQCLDDYYLNATQPYENNKSLHHLKLQQKAYNIFKEKIFVNKIEVIQGHILDYIDQERSGETIDIAMMKNAVDIFIALDPTFEQFYNKLEFQFLQRARDFYQLLSQRSLEHDTLPEFMIKCEMAFNTESKRIDNYMNQFTQLKIRNILDDELLKKNVEILVKSKESGVRILLEHDRYEDLERMFRLIKHLDNQIGVNLMVEEFEEYLRVVANKLMYSLYIDDLMKSKACAILDEQVNKQLDEIVALIYFVDQKSELLDLIEDHLFERIIEQGSEPLTNDKVEKEFIRKLNQEYGDAFVMKLDHMLQDHDHQIELNRQFKDYQERIGLNPKLCLEVLVLSKPLYPSVDVFNVNLPENIQHSLQSFKDFYKEIQPCQTIEFAPQLGSVTVEVQFMSKMCSITMEPIQALILLQFADGAMKSMRELAEITELGMEEVEINTVSLMLNTPIIVRAPEGAEQVGQQHEFGIGYDEQLKLNKYLKPDRTDFRIINPYKYTIREQSPQYARKTHISLIIYGLMRTQKTMKYKDLLNPATNNLTWFRTSKYEVKVQIEDLIARQFLKRKEDDRDTIEYIP
ncbi:MAG: putative CULlin protein 1 [Streblomastix strix]|uniref:Putative CULlin protein 1 n=1 Tax=Streblomastix strix TaxID=222440 RepID=A0A5J4VYI0_9EUKA|nr:MAG: putative CULlin protein 1 [Streblomastix strix]